MDGGAPFVCRTKGGAAGAGEEGGGAAGVAAVWNAAAPPPEAEGASVGRKRDWTAVASEPRPPTMLDGILGNIAKFEEERQAKREAERARKGAARVALVAKAPPAARLAAVPHQTSQNPPSKSSSTPSAAAVGKDVEELDPAFHRGWAHGAACPNCHTFDFVREGGLRVCKCGIVESGSTYESFQPRHDPESGKADMRTTDAQNTLEEWEAFRALDLLVANMRNKFKQYDDCNTNEQWLIDLSNHVYHAFWMLRQEHPGLFPNEYGHQCAMTVLRAFEFDGVTIKRRMDKGYSYYDDRNATPHPILGEGVLVKAFAFQYFYNKFPDGVIQNKQRVDLLNGLERELATLARKFPKTVYDQPLNAMKKTEKTQVTHAYDKTHARTFPAHHTSVANPKRKLGKMNAALHAATKELSSHDLGRKLSYAFQPFEERVLQLQAFTFQEPVFKATVKNRLGSRDEEDVARYNEKRRQYQDKYGWRHGRLHGRNLQGSPVQLRKGRRKRSDDKDSDSDDDDDDTPPDPDSVTTHD